MARYSQARRDNIVNIPRLKVRSGKAKAEWEAYKISATKAFELNEVARKKGEEVSYSIRDDGRIWKFAKTDSGAWRRVTDWAVPESENC